MHHPNCCHCHKGSSVHQAWKHIYHHKRTTCFWSRSHHCIMVAYDSWQKLACLPCSKGRHIAWGIGPACSKGTDCIRTLFPPPAITGASMLLILFYGIEVVSVQSSDHRYTTVDLEPKLYHIFSFPNHLQSDNGALCLQWLPNNEPIVKISDDIPHSLPSTGIWYCQALNSLLKTIWLYFSLSSHTLGKQFSHLMEP